MTRRYFEGTPNKSRSVRRLNLLPRVDLLEERVVLSGPSDMTEFAKEYLPHPGATRLFLAFDGFSVDGRTISPYMGTTGDRERDIQEILYRTYEAFAPFNVEVQRAPAIVPLEMFSGGNSFIAIGDAQDYKNIGGETPSKYSDYPSGIKQQPNSHAFDLAFVDPVYQTDRTRDMEIDDIVHTTIHEAGHTFGLTHIRTVGSDPTEVAWLESNTHEAMSYDSTNSIFRNQTFPITGANRNPDPKPGESANPISQWNKPWWTETTILPIPIVEFHFMETQNSYTYLKATVGSRPADDFSGIAHPSVVDTTYQVGTLKDIDSGPWTGTISGTGDYDAFRMETWALGGNTEQLIRATVEPTSGSSLDPVLFVYETDGNLVAFNNDRGAGSKSSEVLFNATSPYNLRFVVGASDGLTQGGYRIRSSVVASLNRSTGVLTIDGTASDDEIEVTRLGSLYLVNVNGITGTLSYGSAADVVINGAGGNDRVVLNLGDGIGRTYNFTPGGLNHSIGSIQPYARFTDVERAEVIGTFVTDTLSVNGLPNGMKELKFRAGAGNDVATITSLQATQSVLFEAGPGADRMTTAYLAAGQVAFASGADSDKDSLIIDDRNTTLASTYSLDSTSITRGSAGKVTFDTVEDLTIYAGPGADSLATTQMPSGALVTFDGGTQVDTIQGRDIPNGWFINSNNGGMLNTNLAFVDVEELRGGSDIDWFHFAKGMGVTGAVKGGGGSDTMNYWAYATPIAVNLQTETATGTGGFQGIETIIGGSAADTLTGANYENTWTITAEKSGRVEWLVGTPPLLWSKRLDFVGFETLVGGIYDRNKGIKDTLIATDADNTWNLTGNGSGNLNGGINFTGMENLTGGSGRDQLKIAAAGLLLGRFDGLGGTNGLDYSAWSNAVTVNLSTGFATAAGGGVSGIVDVTGGNGGDTITGNSLANRLRGGKGNDTIRGSEGNDILIGGEGVDTLFGEGGRDLLIGGIGADKLYGGLEDDLLFSGTTSYDANDLALAAILQEWGRVDLPPATSYATRVANLRQGVTRGVLLDATTVRNDTVLDVLVGDDGQNWYWGNLQAMKSDPRKGKEFLN